MKAVSHRLTENVTAAHLLPHAECYRDSLRRIVPVGLSTAPGGFALRKRLRAQGLPNSAFEGRCSK